VETVLTKREQANRDDHGTHAGDVHHVSEHVSLRAAVSLDRTDLIELLRS